MHWPDFGRELLPEFRVGIWVRDAQLLADLVANPGCGSGQEQRQTRGGLRTVGRIKREGLAGPGRVSGTAQVFAVFPAAITQLRFLYAAQADLANRFIGTTALPIRRLESFKERSRYSVRRSIVFKWLWMVSKYSVQGIHITKLPARLLYKLNFWKPNG